MATPERDHSSTLTRRRFVQGVAAVGIAAAVRLVSKTGERPVCFSS